ncbi:unnamed protein product [Darwinula stevensoni]|uniref:Uncharacterized protein n=1 Tax=Darwinula stevensoni TaxID=69355 RepID=A0A7R8XBH7_9CRUS|nr:unnamed protein product [Darwinula stevensoni]CAG0891555.1 unnamed protein product [Darwinula stevensoni]
MRSRQERKNHNRGRESQVTRIKGERFLGVRVDMDAKALAKPPAFFKYGEIIFGLLALSLFRAAYSQVNLQVFSDYGRASSIEEEINKTLVIHGTLVGLFLSTLVFPFALLFGHKTGSMEIIHGGVSALFYLATGGLLLKEITQGNAEFGEKFDKMMIASGAFCIILALVFIADVVFVALKWRRASD